MVEPVEREGKEHGEQDGEVAVEVEPPWPDGVLEVEEAKSAGNNDKEVFYKVERQKSVLLGIIITDKVGIRVSEGEYKPDVSQTVDKPGWQRALTERFQVTVGKQVNDRKVNQDKSTRSQS